MNDLLSSIPIYWAKIIAVFVFLGGILWTWFRPKDFVFKDSPDNKRWRDLRIWITVIMIFQIIIYLYF